MDLEAIKVNWTPMGRSSFVCGLGSMVNSVCYFFPNWLQTSSVRSSESCKIA